jgi:MrcB-like, N-terminal domain/Domain of unknown function (DUF3883)
MKGMQAELQEVLALQAEWTSERSAAMVQRGRLVRYECPRWLIDHEQALADAIEIPVNDFFAEGRDATGRKTRVPWTRFGSRQRSPRATRGFYVVYLFAFDGSAVYLSLNQGTTEFEEGAYVRRPAASLTANVRWAQDVVGDWMASRTDLVKPDLRDIGVRSLGDGYEIGNIAALRYEAGGIPSDGRLLRDGIDFGLALGALYREQDRLPSPEEVPEVVEAEETAQSAAGKPRPPRAGFRQNKEERDLIERHAEDMAADHYAAQGWNVEKKGRPFDLKLSRGEEQITVEVKGTTSKGAAVVLTRNEVEHHKEAFPHHALVIVRNIELDRSTAPPTVSGGELFERQPWKIDDGALTIVSYTYEIPQELYD